jgi:hypothetical protein
VEGSIFCDAHREQATRFSLAFGRQDGDRSLAARPAEEGDGDQTLANGASLNDDRRVLAAAFHAAFHDLRQRPAEHTGPERWPQLSLYLLDQVLHCRAYFSIIPRAGESQPGHTYLLDDDRVFAAVAVGGVVFERLHPLYDQHLGELERQDLQTLDVHFLTYAGLVAINAHPAGGKPINLVTFALESDGFHETALDDEVRARMRHTYW